jgi:hypothetical protein
MGHELQKFTGNGDEQLPTEIRHAALPALIVRAGEKGAYRFLEFFAAHIRNPNTRAAYYHDVCVFFAWCEKRRMQDLSDIRSAHIAG